MADPQKTPRSSTRVPHLPALERLAPTPDAARLAAQIEALSSPGDVVLELHGRGGWVARSAIDEQRRAFAIESSALTRLLAEVVLRPPDLRHFDAAVSAIAVDARGTEGGLRHAIEATYASRCATCDGPVTVDEFIWEAEATDPSRKSYDCPRCRDGRGDGRPVKVDPDDLYLARSVDRDAARAALISRFPTPSPEHPLPAELVDLYSPRAQVALVALLERIETEIRASSVQAALRLAVVHMALSISSLNGYPGRASQIRIAAGQVRRPSSRQWRERNVWKEFEEACRILRGFIAALASEDAAAARVGPDLRSLIEGSANVALRFGTPAGPETFGQPPRPGTEPGARPRVKPGIRLVLSQPPIHWSAENVAFAYVASSLALGPDAAATLPLSSIFGSVTRSGWARDASTLERALTAVRPVLLPDAKVVIVLDDAGPEGLVSTVIGGVAAGLKVDDAVLGDAAGALDGTVQFTLPRATLSSDRDMASGSPSYASKPFAIAAVEAAIADIAVAVIQLRGEPTRFDRILGEVLLGLDHLGHLRRLVGTRIAVEPDEETTAQHASGLWGELGDAPGADADEDEPANDGLDSGARERSSRRVADPDAPQLPWDDVGPASDPVRLTLDIIRKEMQREQHPRLHEVDEGLWWLRDAKDLAAVKTPLAERVEWGIFSLLSTSGGITKAAFRDRVRRLYRGPETADEELIETCLASYRRPGPSEDDLIHTDESLQTRYQEHGDIVGVLTEFAHRIGMRAWISKREQRRRYAGATLGDLLSDPEQRVYLPLVAPGPQEVLEDIDCLWYVRGRGAFLFDVEWMAALDEPIRQRGPRIDTTESLVRFLVVPDERVPLVRLRLARSPLLRRQIESDNWHILKWSHVRRLPTSKRADLSVLSPLIGLDPPIENDADQMALFG